MPKRSLLACSLAAAACLIPCGVCAKAPRGERTAPAREKKAPRSEAPAAFKTDATPEPNARTAGGPETAPALQPQPEPVSVPAPRAAEKAFPREIVMREPHSIPIFWDGREIGRKVIAAGTRLQAFGRSGSQVECREKGQTFQVPAALTDVDDPATADAVAALSGPAAAPASVSAPVVAPAPPIAPQQPAAASVESNDAATPAAGSLQAAKEYVASVLGFIASAPAQTRFVHYSQMRRFRPDSLRSLPRDAAAQGALDASAATAARAAVVRYDFGQWWDFEKSIQVLAQGLGIRLPGPSKG